MARTSAPDLPQQVREVAEEAPPERVRKTFGPNDLVPTGSTMLNLACADNTDGGFMLGGVVTTPGQSSAGKTIMALTCLAECSINARFDTYELILDDSEERLAFDIGYLFGERVKNSIIPPPLGNSKHIQAFESNLMTLKKQNKKCIYVLDSFDALSSLEELEKEMKKALAMAKSDEAVKALTGSFNAEKAKIAGQTLRMVNDYLEASNSLLLIIQQRRQKMNAGPFGDPWTTSGGEAPEYYSNHRIWYSKIGAIKDNKTGLVVGTNSEAKIKKNSATGKYRDVKFDIYYDYGVDDVGSMIDFMVTEEFWKKNSGHKIDAFELDLLAPRKELIQIIEEDRLESEIRKAVGQAWLVREEEARTKRKPKYL